MFLLYNSSLIIFYKIIAPILSIFSKKIRIWLIEQRKIPNFIESINNDKKIWVHCSSVGEYEQKKPIIKYFEENHKKMIITFFSPDAYKYLKGKIPHPCSLFPLDTEKNITNFIKRTNTEKIFIAKNEIWPNLINICYQKTIPIYLIGSKIKSSTINNIFYGKYYCDLLKKIDLIFVQDEESQKILKNKKIDSILSGDPRVDQVLIDQEEPKKENLLIKNFINGEKVILAGSTESEDYHLFEDLMNSGEERWIIVPHKNSKKEINNLVKRIKKKWSLYSNPNDLKKSKILIIDKIGILKYIYKYSNIVYVGGGFSKGIHNCLEPAIFGKPILLGPKYKNFPEANYFINNKIAFCVKNQKEFKNFILNQAFNYEDLKMKTRLFFKKHQGASQRIIQEISI